MIIRARCPECLKVKAKPALLEKPRTCPKCKQVVEFVRITDPIDEAATPPDLSWHADDYQDGEMTVPSKQVQMYCPKCGGGASASTVCFQQKVQCPHCDKVGRFSPDLPDTELFAPGIVDKVKSAISNAAGKATQVREDYHFYDARQAERVREDEDIAKFIKASNWITLIIGMVGWITVATGASIIITASRYSMYALFLGLLFIILGLIQVSVRTFVMKFARLFCRIVIAVETPPD